jgi:broad specificity phosphatase PhoE
LGRTDISAPEGESPDSVKERCVSFIMQQINVQKADNLVFVMHGRVIRVLLAWFLDQTLSTMHKYPHHNANINELHYANGQFVASSINEVTHLKEL